MEETELIKELRSQGYFAFKQTSDKGLCGIFKFIFTYGICYGLDAGGCIGRYCFENVLDAILALDSWDGTGDPPGRWIKHKGKIEYANNTEI